MHNSIIIFPRVALGSSHNSVDSPCSTPRPPPASWSHRSLSLAYAGVFHGLGVRQGSAPPTLHPAPTSLPFCSHLPNQPTLCPKTGNPMISRASALSRSSCGRSPRSGARAAACGQRDASRATWSPADAEAARGGGLRCHPRHVPRDSLLQSFQESG